MRGQAVLSAQFYARINLLIVTDFIQLRTGVRELNIICHFYNKIRNYPVRRKQLDAVNRTMKITYERHPVAVEKLIQPSLAACVLVITARDQT